MTVAKHTSCTVLIVNIMRHFEDTPIALSELIVALISVGMYVLYKRAGPIPTWLLLQEGLVEETLGLRDLEKTVTLSTPESVA